MTAEKLLTFAKGGARCYSTLSATHEGLRETCRRFSEKHLKHAAAELDREQKFPSEQIRKMGELGLMGILVDEKYGGAGLDTLSLSLAVEQISRGCAGTAAIVAIHNALYAGTIDRVGNDWQKEVFLKPFVDGTFVGCFALSEPGSGSDAANMSTSATCAGDHWVLNGTKAWVTNASEAKATVVIASFDKQKGHKGTVAFLVPIPTEGLSCGKKEDKLGIRASSTCSLTFDNVKVPSSHLLGNIGDGFKIAMSSIDCARICIASQALGIAQASLDCAVHYANTRIAFGNPILQLQAVKHRVARMAVQLEASRLLTRRAAHLRDLKQPFTMEAAMAKLSASESATSISHNCIQILGGMGYVSDMPAERHYRDARITEIYAGPTDIQLLVIADRLIRKYGFAL